MKKYFYLLTSCGILWIGCGKTMPNSQSAILIDRTPKIDPDYSNEVIPPNIAPLNFRLLESLDEAALEISSKSGEPITLFSSDSVFQIPIDEWKALLNKNIGEQFTIKIMTKKDGQWHSFQPITNLISKDSIDPYLSYRIINPAFGLWRVVGIYQRHIESYEENPILINKLTQGSCMNCHNFMSGNPEYMMMHIRGGPASGTLIRRKNDIRKVNTATDFNKAGSYPAWHPGGNIIAMSVNKLSMYFHAQGESRDVLDSGSDIVLYLIDQNMITTCPDIANTERMESFPCWSPDGKYLYFSAANKLDSYVGMRNGKEDLFWEKLRYDIMRIPYDEQTNTWGKLEMVLSSNDVGGSLTFPRLSPDGKLLLITKADYGHFPVNIKSADVMLYDLQTKKIKSLESNSDNTDSFHAWSRNSKWFVFSSRRENGYASRPYFSHLDENNIASKPVLLPQDNPAYYDTYLKAFNVPELMTGPVDIDPRRWGEVAMGKAINAQLDPKVKENPYFKTVGPKADVPELYQKSR